MKLQKFFISWVTGKLIDLFELIFSGHILLRIFESKVVNVANYPMS